MPESFDDKQEFKDTDQLKAYKVRDKGATRSTGGVLPEQIVVHSSLWRDLWNRLKHNWLAMIGLGIVLIMILTAIFAPFLATKNPLETDLNHSFEKPSSEYLMGTDLLGRDIYSRIVYGARVSLIVGVIATSIMIVLGLIFGGLAAYYGGFIETIIMRLADVFFAFPYVLGAIALITVLGSDSKPGLSFYIIFNNVRNIFIAIGILGWPTIARVFRSSILSVKETEYILAARALGANDLRIMARHILPNSIQPIIVYGTMTIGAAIITEAALSFLGIGVQPPTPAWGYMLAASRTYFFRASWTMYFPGLAIVITVLGFILLGDGLRDALDPRLKD